MASSEPSPEALEKAVEALAEPGRMRAAEDRVQRVAPQLQRLLARVLAEEGWFDDAHRSQLEAALGRADPSERRTALETLIADETRLGMLVGVAVGWELARELDPGWPSSQ